MADTYIVELGYTSGFTLNDSVAGVLDTSQLGADTFIDVTSYVTGISVKRGKNRELDRISAGSLSIDFRNDNRVFDPTNSRSPLYGKIVPRSKIRVFVDVNMTSGMLSYFVTRPIFYGFVNDWNFNYDISGDLTASLDASDGFTVLARQQLVPGTAVQQLSGARVTAVLDMSTVKWPPLERSIDTGLSLLGSDVFDGNVLDYLQTVADSENGLLFMDSSGNLSFVDRSVTPTTNSLGDPQYNYFKYPPWQAVNDANWAVTITDATYTKYLGDDGSNALIAQYYVTTTNPAANSVFTLSIAGAAENASGFTDPTYVTYNFAAGNKESHSLELKWYNSSNVLLRTDSQSFSGTNYAHYYIASPPSGAVKVTFGILCSLPYSTSSQIVEISDVLISSDWTEYYDGWMYSDNYSYVKAWTGTAFASSTVRQLVIWNAPPLEFNNDGTGIPYQNVVVNYGTELMMNQAEFTSPTGTAVSNNEQSQRDYGIVAGSVSTLVATSAQLQALADYRVAKYNSPELRFELISLELKSLTAAQRSNVLDLEIGDLCNIKFQPKNSDYPITQTAQIIGIGHNVQPDRHTVDFSFEILPFTFFVLNDLGYGKLDGIGTLGF